MFRVDEGIDPYRVLFRSMSVLPRRVHFGSMKGIDQYIGLMGVLQRFKVYYAVLIYKVGFACDKR